MDPIVKQAMAKWPNVPHCYGWLALDARGGWFMRDERAQQLDLIGERIRNPALLGFINRNYLHDEAGRWYFQNGPQRVYANLELTPYIARTDPQQGLLLHTGAALGPIDAVWLTETGQPILRSGACIAALDDRDIAACLPHFQMHGQNASDEQLLHWLDGSAAVPLTWNDATPRAQSVPVQRIARDALASYFGFVLRPQPTPTPTSAA
jgi:hypothetical protein